MSHAESIESCEDLDCDYSVYQQLTAMFSCTCAWGTNSHIVWSGLLLALSPGSPPLLCFMHAILFTRNLCWAWAALITCGHWLRVQCPLRPRMRVETNKKEAWISVHQNVSWESCPVIDLSVEHSRKPLTRASFSLFSTRNTWTQWTLNASSVSARDQSLPPPMLKHKICVNKIARIKQRGGGEPGDEANFRVIRRISLISTYSLISA